MKTHDSGDCLKDHASLIMFAQDMATQICGEPVVLSCSALSDDFVSIAGIGGDVSVEIQNPESMDSFNGKQWVPPLLRYSPESKHQHPVYVSCLGNADSPDSRDYFVTAYVAAEPRPVICMLTWLQAITCAQSVQSVMGLEDGITLASHDAIYERLVNVGLSAAPTLLPKAFKKTRPRFDQLSSLRNHRTR